METCVVYMTAPDAAAARTVADALISERLCACVNIYDGVRSVFFWDGAVQDEPEVTMIAKTRRDLFDALLEKVKAVHPYDVPCVICLPIADGNPEFLQWIADETR
jgi:periplasmic divalent cation tolerance protein